MAAATVIALPPIPGLQNPFTVNDLNVSNTTYNELPRIHSDMSVHHRHVKRLGNIIAQHHLREKLGIHLIHKHEDIPNGHIHLEMKLKTIPGKWTQSVSIGSLDLSKIHGVIFKYIPGENALVPYEFACGSSPVTMSDLTNNDCIEEVLSYITMNDLVNVIALEFLEPVQKSQAMESAAEIEVGKYGTIVLPRSRVRVEDAKLVPTGWPNIGQSYDPDAEPDPGTHWAPVKVGNKETHRVFVDKVENESELLDELARQELIVKV